MQKLNVKNFPENIRKQIKKKNITQKQLANDVGMTEVIVSWWVNGKAHPTMKAAVKLAEYFGCGVDDLLKGDKQWKSGKKRAKARS